MGGFFGAACKYDAISDVFFGTDYHSHLGTKRGGMAAYDSEIGLQRDIHNIENSPFRTKFDKVFEEMKGSSAIGCISDTDPQPLLVRSSLGTYAISIIGIINNAEELIENYLRKKVLSGTAILNSYSLSSTRLKNNAVRSVKSNFCTFFTDCASTTF